MTIRFLHIPKTAGTAFTGILKRLYPGTIHFSFSSNIKADIERFNNLPEKKRKEIKVFKGHAPISTGLLEADAASIITLLRDPIERVKSFCQHVSEGKAPNLRKMFPPERFDLDLFLENGSEQLSNLQTKMLINSGHSSSGYLLETLSPFEAKQMALENLRKKVLHFGLTEFFDESLIIFARAFDWPTPYYLHKNQKDLTKPLKFNDRHLRRLAELNSIDIEVYSAARMDFLNIIHGAEFDKKKLAVLRLTKPFYSLSEKMKLSDALKRFKLGLAREKVSRRVEHGENLPDWTRLLQKERKTWSAAKQAAQTGPNVLVATAVGGLSALSSLESLLTVALTLRGARVHTLLCDGALPACLRVDYASIPDARVIVDYGVGGRLCESCQTTGRYLFDSLGVHQHRLGDLVGTAQRHRAKRLAADVPVQQIPAFRLDGIAVGEHAYAGTLRYFASGNLQNEPQGEAVMRRYLEAAILTAEGLKQLMSRFHFQTSCFNHGIYCPQGVIGDVLRKAGTRVVNWNIAYRKKCFIFSQEDTYHHTLLDEPVAAWDSMSWTDVEEKEITEYLQSRWHGSNDWIWFHEKPEMHFEKIVEELKLDRTRPMIGMLTNVMWDAQLHYRANAFPDMLSWVLETIAYFARRPDLQLVVRIHPAEIRGTLPSRQPLLAEIGRAWPELPDNVKIIPPESPVSTYAVMGGCDSVLIYGTKTGVELTSIGIPVVVAGEAWIRNKGVTLDASTREEYISLLDSLPVGRRLNDDVRRRALKYAYHFFYRRMIPLGFMEPTGAWPPYRPAIDSLQQLMPGADTGLDIICDGIMNGSPFIYPAERLTGAVNG